MVVTAKNDVDLNTAKGDITVESSLSAGNDVAASTSAGNISVNGVVGAVRDIKAAGVGGNIAVQGILSAGLDVIVTNKDRVDQEGNVVQQGNVILGGTVIANRDVDVTTESGNITFTETSSVAGQSITAGSTGILNQDDVIQEVIFP